MKNLTFKKIIKMEGKESMNWDYYVIKYELEQRHDKKAKEVLAKMEKMTNEEFNNIWWTAKTNLFLDMF